MTFYNYIENAKGKVADIVNDWTQEGANTKAYVNDNLDGARREYMQLAIDNAKLRQQLADVTESMGRVEERCAKLRELVTDVHESLREDKAGMFHKLILASMEDDMRELGVEVGE